jgi:retron-type reverse transcriptase
MGPRLLQLLTHFWTSLQVVARQQGYYGAPFRSERGTTQGDIISPTIFNIVVDAVVREWYHRLEQDGLATKVGALFYADDGHFYSHDADALERATELIVELFESIGLQTNTTKTKAMICAPQPTVTRICSPAYKRRMGINADEPTHRERKRQKIECDICQQQVQARSLARHKRIKHGTES